MTSLVPIGLYHSLLFCAISVVLAACGGTDGKQAQTRAPDQTGPVRDPGVVHVHGLGVNPKDGALYAATHTGLFRIVDGTATRVGDRFQDTMGFVVAGPDHFWGSGHPDMRDYNSGKLPGLLGFIESKDAGLTWTPLALLGKADLHVLAMSQGMIYGFDSTGGKLLRSQDGKRWEERSAAPILSFAVSPVSPDVLVATTPRGMQFSRDGGRTWTAQGDASLALLSWTGSGLFGLDAMGTTFESRDEGRTWAERGSLPGRPEALVADGGRLFAGVTEQGIYTSTDGGMTWILFYKDSRARP